MSTDRAIGLINRATKPFHLLTPCCRSGLPTSRVSQIPETKAGDMAEVAVIRLKLGTELTKPLPTGLKVGRLLAYVHPGRLKTSQASAISPQRRGL